MPSQRFLVHYPDDSKERISKERRDGMLMRDELHELGGGRYLFIGVYTPKTFKCRSFEGLRSLLILRGMTSAQIRAYLERLEVLWKLRSEQEWQAEETPEGFEARLIAMGMPEGGFESASGRVQAL